MKNSVHPTVFLSHTKADKLFARQLAMDLRRFGVRVWLDEAEMKVGDSLIDKISDAIGKVDYLIVILSPESLQSKWVRKELNLAIIRELDGELKILPLLHKKCQLPAFLKEKLYADFSSQEKYIPSLRDLLRALGVTQDNRKDSALYSRMPLEQRLLVQLESNKEEDIISAIEQLHEHRMASKPVIVALLKMVEHDSSSVRYAAEQALKENIFRGKSAARELINIIRKGEIPAKESATQILLNYGPKLNPHFREIVQLLSENQPESLIAAAKIIDRMGKTAVDAVPPLIAQLEHQDVDVRIQMAASLGELGSNATSAGPALIKLMRDSVHDARVAAICALGKIGPSVAISIPSLINSLKHPDWEAKTEIILGFPDEYSDVRFFAAEALGKMGVKADVAAVDLIEAMEVREHDVHEAARKSIVNIAKESSKALKVLVRALKHKNELVRTDVCWALKAVLRNQPAALNPYSPY
ncbi:MAG: TIR domain-containing protein [Candidatus Aminicenantaceae bacterium]